MDIQVVGNVMLDIRDETGNLGAACSD